MIPTRVSLQGFLCYRDQRTLEFGETDLWVLAGANGSGKSSVFDAITFALFGQHRGGSQNYVDLINQESDALAIEFEFKLEGERYRIRRTVKRQKRGPQSSQQVARWDGSDWATIPGTEQKRGLDDWVKDRVGLDYEAFTSSVILLQGKAERLLDSEPRKRFELLARVVDLDRYARLHGRADDERKTLKLSAESCQRDLDGLPVVREDEVKALEADIAAVEARLTVESEAVEAARQAVFLAGAFAKLSVKLAERERELQQFDAALADANRTERDHATLQELAAVLPHFHTVITQRGAASEADRRAADKQAEAQRAAEAVTASDHALAQNRDKRLGLDKRQILAETQASQADKLLRELDVKMVQLKALETARAEWERLDRDLAGFPADRAERLQRAEDERDAALLFRELKLLAEPFRTATATVTKLRAEVETASDNEASVLARGAELKRLSETAARRLERAEAEAARLENELAGQRSLLVQAERDFADFGELHGSRVCRHCGQALTPAHYATERGKRERLVAELTAAVAALNGRWQPANTERETARTDAKRWELEIVSKREEFRACQRESKRVGEAIAAAEREVAERRSAYAERLPATERERFAPERIAADSGALAELAGRANRAESAARDAKALAEQARERQRAETRRGDCQRQLAERERELGEAPETVRKRAVQAKLDAEAATKERAAIRAAMLDNQREKDGIEKARDSQRAEHSALSVAAQKHLLEAQDARRQHTAALTQVPVAWRARVDAAGFADHHKLESQYGELIKGQTAERHAKLIEARHARAGTERDVRELRAEADGYPPAVRVPVATAEASLRERQSTAERSADEAKHLHRQRDAQRDALARRADLDSRLRGIDAELSDAETLAKLLGRDRLQLALVRRAERQIVEYANQMLDRLSGGQMALRLCQRGEDDARVEKALDLEAVHRATGTAAIPIAFLSGSQRFRVAVALALAIGQYAGKQHRPIEAVIIDEGFGCLDRVGRQTMVQELHNLRGLLQCILLVSHQEEFADAFPHGYRFELDDGATRVERIQR